MYHPLEEPPPPVRKAPEKKLRQGRQSRKAQRAEQAKRKAQARQDEQDKPIRRAMQAIQARQAKLANENAETAPPPTSSDPAQAQPPAAQSSGAPASSLPTQTPASRGSVASLASAYGGSAAIDDATRRAPHLSCSCRGRRGRAAWARAARRVRIISCRCTTRRHDRAASHESGVSGAGHAARETGISRAAGISRTVRVSREAGNSRADYVSGEAGISRAGCAADEAIVVFRAGSTSTSVGEAARTGRGAGCAAIQFRRARAGRSAAPAPGSTRSDSVHATGIPTCRIGGRSPGGAREGSARQSEGGAAKARTGRTADVRTDGDACSPRAVRAAQAPGAVRSGALRGAAHAVPPINSPFVPVDATKKAPAGADAAAGVEPAVEPASVSGTTPVRATAPDASPSATPAVLPGPHSPPARPLPFLPVTTEAADAPDKPPARDVVARRPNVPLDLRPKEARSGRDARAGAATGAAETAAAQRRNRILMLYAATLALMAAGAGGGYWWVNHRIRAARASADGSAQQPARCGRLPAPALEHHREAGRESSRAPGTAAGQHRQRAQLRRERGQQALAVRVHSITSAGWNSMHNAFATTIRPFASCWMPRTRRTRGWMR